MKTLAKILTGFVAIEHIFFMIVEMFLWQRPLGLGMFDLSPEFAAQTLTWRKTKASIMDS